MHPNPAFRGTPQAQALGFARRRAFGTLAVSAEPAPLLSHVPFLLNDEGTSADLHLVRSNPICPAVAEGKIVRLSVTGPDAYTSPDWYETDDQVPTWAYIAVQLTGRLVPLPMRDLPALLNRQSEFFETRLAPKPVWTMDKLTKDTKARMMRMILPFRLTIEDVQSTWKLGQNKGDAARLAAASQVEGGLGTDLAALARLMADPDAP